MEPSMAGRSSPSPTPRSPSPPTPTESRQPPSTRPSLYVTAVSKGILYAHAEEFSLNPKIATYTVTVTDDVGTRIAIFQGMVYRRTPRG